jgi:YHS domain-containing protein
MRLQPTSTGMLGAPSTHRATSSGCAGSAETSFCSVGRRWHDSQEHEGRKGEVMATVTDPVCGMEIDSAAAAASEEYGGKTYYFCSEGCHQQFVAAPEQYAV